MQIADDSGLVRPAWILRLSKTLAIEVQPISFAG